MMPKSKARLDALMANRTATAWLPPAIVGLLSAAIGIGGIRLMGILPTGESSTPLILCAGGVILTALMILSLARTRESTREREALLHNIVETCKDAFFVADMEGNLRKVNDAYCRISGYSRDELSRMNVRDLEADESPVEVAAHIGKIMAEGADIFEARHRTRDGRLWAMEASVTYMPEMGGRIVVFCRDISERKKAEEELQRHRLHLESLVNERTSELAHTHRQMLDTQFAMDQVGIGIFWADDSSARILYANRCATEMVGYSEQELLAMTISDFDKDHSLDDVRRVTTELKVQKRLQFPSTITTKDGRQIPVEVTLFHLGANEAFPDRNIAFVTDITLRRQAEMELLRAKADAEAASQIKSNFLANMSHEIRTPLNAVLGLARIGAKEDPGRKSSEICRQILGAGHHLLAVVNDILDFSKIEAGKFGVARQPFQPAAIIANAASFIAGAADAKGLSFSTALQADFPEWVLGDAQRLQQILTNLLSNAVKFTAWGGVRLQAEAAGAALVFKVSDTGVGITEEQMARLFTAFEQADNTATRSHGGSGLGLAISQRLAGLMGGEIAATSQPGHGSTFTLTLPLLVAAAPAPAPDVGAEADQTLAGCCILAVEDVAANRYILEFMLEEAGAKTVFAENGKQAVETVASNPGAFDLVLMDVQMPIMDGYEATRRILNMTPSLPVIGLTAHAMAEDRKKCLDSGMVDYISKPCDPATLIATLKRWRSPAVPPLAAPPGAVPAAPAPSSPDTAGETDWDELTRRFGFKPGLVGKLIMAAIDGQKHRPQELRSAAAAVAAGQATDLAGIVHALKGVAGNLQAQGLTDEAAELELMIKIGSPDVPELAEHLARRTETWLAEMAAWVELETGDGKKSNIA